MLAIAINFFVRRNPITIFVVHDVILMAGILNEYIDKRLGINELLKELDILVGKYNKMTGRYLFVFSSDFTKGRRGVDDIALFQEDFYNIQDILRESQEKRIDFYLETPGGSGEAAEEIARFLHKKFDEVRFLICGEAKSAGTILAMSGDSIMMTDSGSLGPIDAQVRIGRHTVSAYDYKAWVEGKRNEAAQNGKLNPFDAVMVAQISPGEIYGVYNSLEFATDLVKKWLVDYKFKDWTITSSGNKVTQEKKVSRATEVAEFLCDHMSWRSHGRSLKIEDLREYLLIDRIDDNPELADVVYRINTVLRLIFSNSSIYKVYKTADTFLSKTAMNGVPTLPMPQSLPVVPANKAQTQQVQKVELEVICPKCHKKHIVPGYVNMTSQQVRALKLQVNPLVTDKYTLVCDNCGFELDLKPIKNQLEMQHRISITFK